MVSIKPNWLELNSVISWKWIYTNKNKAHPTENKPRSVDNDRQKRLMVKGHEVWLEVLNVSVSVL